MNYDQPRQLGSGGWHYTTFNRRIGTFPIGYCASQHPDAPHETEDDARRCYRDYQLAEQLRDAGEFSSWNRCQAQDCEELTNGGMQLGGFELYILCPQHRTREIVAGLYGPLAGDSWHS